MIPDERFVKNLIQFGKWFTLVSIAVSIGAKGKYKPEPTYEGYGNIKWGLDRWSG